ncbi:MAG: hypothetical protein ACOY94_10910 [Bacillota bacterium]
MPHRALPRWAILPVLALLLGGCAPPPREPQAIRLVEGLTASYRVRVEERLLSEGMVGFMLFTATLHRNEVVEFDLDLTIQQVDQDSATVQYRLHRVAVLSPEEKRLPERVVTARINPRTGDLKGLESPVSEHELEPARWLRGLLLIPPDGGQVEPGVLWTRAERFRLAGAEYEIGFDLPWRIRHDQTDRVDRQSVASLFVERERRVNGADLVGELRPDLTGRLTTSGFARVDADTGLVRVMELQEQGRFSFPLTNGAPIPWMLVHLEGRLIVTRTHLYRP